MEFQRSRPPLGCCSDSCLLCPKDSDWADQSNCSVCCWCGFGFLGACFAWFGASHHAFLTIHHFTSRKSKGGPYDARCSPTVFSVLAYTCRHIFMPLCLREPRTSPPAGLRLVWKLPRLDDADLQLAFYSRPRHTAIPRAGVLSYPRFTAGDAPFAPHRAWTSAFLRECTGPPHAQRKAFAIIPESCSKQEQSKMRVLTVVVPPATVQQWICH